MKKKSVILIGLLLSLLLCSCSAGRHPEAFVVPKSSIVKYYDGSQEYVTETVYKSHKIAERKDGLYEITGKQMTDGENSYITWLYSSDGIMIGSRTYSESSGRSESLNILDYNIESYINSSPNFDEYEDGVIYYEDGSYEKVKVENGVIVESKMYNLNDELLYRFKGNELGYLESLKQYQNGEVYYTIENKYKEITFE